MSQRRDPLVLSPHWHIDCRLEAELPEDKVVGLRFLAGMIFGLVALVSVLFAGWLSYKISTLDHQIHDWEIRLAENRSEARELMQMQGGYREQADRVDRAYAMIKSTLFVTQFMTSLGHSLPNQVTLDAIESIEGGIVIRGNVKETSNGAAVLLGNYAAELRKNPEISPLFKAIKVTNLERSRTSDDRSYFEITFFLTKPPS
jgi:hypothetical protein